MESLPMTKTTIVQMRPTRVLKLKSHQHHPKGRAARSAHYLQEALLQSSLALVALRSTSCIAEESLSQNLEATRRVR